MSLTSEFKEFVARGNVVDLAVGVLMGTAFGKIVSSVVADVVMPPLGLLIGGMSFSHMRVTLREAGDKDHPAVTLNYGLFLESILDFLLIALAVFLLVKVVNQLRRRPPPPEAAPPAPTKEEVLLTEIRDAIRAAAKR
jgi:large conductance mechanosensitive channel